MRLSAIGGGLTPKITQLLNMGEQSKTRLDGDDYQHLYSWYELLSLLKDDSPFDHGYVEHPEAGAADDVTLHPAPRAEKPSRYVQVKFHVDFRKGYSFDEFLKTQKQNERSLLQKLFDSWKKLRKDGKCEIWLVSNWACDDDLGSVVCGKNWVLLDRFHQSTPRSTLGRSRSAWKLALGANNEEFEEFLKSLRLRFSFGAHTDIEERCDDRMASLEMKTGVGPRAHAIAAVRAWIQQGGENKRIDKASILKAIDDYGMAAAKGDVPRVSLCIHAWAKRVFDVAPTIALDWTAEFNRDTRTIPDGNGWLQLLAQLHDAKSKLSGLADATFIDFRGKMPLSCALMAGAVFPSVGGYTFRTEQPTDNEISLWNSKDSASTATFVVKHENGGTGDDALIVLAITASALGDAQSLYTSGNVFTKLIYAEPSTGTGSKSMRGAADAVALASSAKQIFREVRSSLNAKRLHLVLFGPLSFALFLGQQLNSLGTVITYERTIEGDYKIAATLRTG
jgi:hypothetical protein